MAALVTIFFWELNYSSKKETLNICEFLTISVNYALILCYKVLSLFFLSIRLVLSDIEIWKHKIKKYDLKFNVFLWVSSFIRANLEINIVWLCLKYYQILKEEWLSLNYSILFFKYFAKISLKTIDFGGILIFFVFDW